MTREEKLQQFAEQNTKGLHLDRHNLIQMVKQGAEWADQHPQWIPVEEELPPKRKDPIVISDKVFIHTTGGHYLSAVYDHQDKEWIDEYNIETLEPNEVTHWMKIVPPKKEE